MSKNYERLNTTSNMTQVPPSCGGEPAETYVGMAHFAGGTPGKFCRQCRFHGMSKGKNMSRVGDVRAFPCAKAKQMGCKTPMKVPANAHACKYFEPK
ncbi:hypothetical protein B0E33_01415 [Roseibium algicola]|uniref:Uncharacterized protein n=1 Tax=Roseibium algicola TaxID=2857014 RepID=A0ABM6HWI4_9HYPH|nr:hypothetical protein [Roseibium aggregatum]AQQ02414.1 hypothetical protein B0E33_01415 [Roseibium aggregatum]